MQRTIDTIAVVTANRQLTVEVPPSVAPGEHRVVVIIDEEPTSASRRGDLALPLYDVGPWPDDLSLHRFDIYDDSGR